MTIIGELLLTNLLAYLINLASGERSAAIAANREAKLRDALEENEVLREALASTHSIRDEVFGACTELARSRATLGVPAHEEGLWRLLSDDVFQADLAEWLMAGAIEEGNAAKERLLHAMEITLSDAGASAEQIAFLKSGYFDALEKTVYANPILARWRHQLSLDYLREQVSVLRLRAEEAAGVFSPQKQTAAIERYCEKALSAWDIIDLSNLPEGDIHMATQKLLLRQLYMPLRIEVEHSKPGEGDEAVLARLEQERDARRHREAGHFLIDEPDRQKTRAPVGERMAASRRLVILGDPGGGKTTMLRWMATAYLLRHKGDAAFSQVPDTQTLPAQPWIPVLIRCRDLGEQDLCRCFVDFLTQHLNKTELLPDEAEVMRAVILDRIAKGEALLLVDGLDEITNPRVRMMFCQELERTAVRYPEAPIVVTSRIVGYRDMPYRMGSGFEHGQIADLDNGDKDLFASRWVEVTEQHQSKDEKAKRAQELLDALHSNDRIERLTGNPMLLTTLALVKRKVGKLPNKRTKLYAEAVSVLLNWNPRLYQTIEEDEAVPQLEYLAYEMCRRGVQRLPDDEVLDLLDRLRVEYPNIRAIRRREPHAFLKHLEERSSILIKSGAIWQKNSKQEKPVWEFRHLTFQEYLAARALLDGRYPGRDKKKSLAEQVGPLAGAVQKAHQSRRLVPNEEEEVEVPESWRETLRLLVADCNDDDVDSVLLAILNPLQEEDAGLTARPRAVLATLCLVDEPNVSEETAQKVFEVVAVNSRESESEGGPMSFAVVELGCTMWAPMLTDALVKRFSQCAGQDTTSAGSLCGRAEAAALGKLYPHTADQMELLTHQMQESDANTFVTAALTLMRLAYKKKAVPRPLMIDALLAAFHRTRGEREAAAWALLWLSGGFRTQEERENVWSPSEDDFSRLVQAHEQMPENERACRRFLIEVISRGALGFQFHTLNPYILSQSPQVREVVIRALGQLGDKQAVAPLLARLNDPDKSVRLSVIGALRQLGDQRAVAPLLTKLDDQDKNVRLTVIGALGQLGDQQAVVPLLTMIDDQDKKVRLAVIGALGQLGDKQAVAPLLAKLDGKDRNVRLAVIGVLGQLGDKQAVAPLLARLDDQDNSVRLAVIASLGQLGDKQAVAPLLAKFDEESTIDIDSRMALGVALHALGEPRGTKLLKQSLESNYAELRRNTVRVYARHRDSIDHRLLSRDIDASDPWLDPREQITESLLTKASSRLDVKPEEVRLRYEAMAADLNLNLSWKT